MKQIWRWWFNWIADDLAGSLLLIASGLLSLVERIQYWQRQHNPDDSRWHGVRRWDRW